jgi:RNA polymerase sigma-70 factor, ECF subfamily
VAVSLRHVVAGSARIQRPGPDADGDARHRLDELFREHADYVARLAYRMMGRDAEIDDVVQDVFVLLLRHLGRIRQPGAVRAWLATTTVRLTRRRLRVKSVRILLGLGDDVGMAEVRDGGSSPEQQAAFRAVHAALEGVGVNARIAWTLRHLEGERIEDVARLCGCSTRTAKRWIARAQRAAKEALGHD